MNQKQTKDSAFKHSTEKERKHQLTQICVAPALIQFARFLDFIFWKISNVCFSVSSLTNTSYMQLTLMITEGTSTLWQPCCLSAFKVVRRNRDTPNYTERSSVRQSAHFSFSYSDKDCKHIISITESNIYEASKDSTDTQWIHTWSIIFGPRCIQLSLFK